jgi:MinD-like ATPase involved in chromosome partitioning or flagellar assembly
MTTAKHEPVRVTVVSPFGQHEIELPANAPVAGLLPDLLAMAGLQLSPARLAADGWHLTNTAGEPIPPDGTLAGHQVAAGAVIQLSRPADQDQDASPGRPARIGVARDDGAVSRHLPRLVASPMPPDDDLTPLQRAEAVLPDWISKPTRLRAMSQAFLHAPGDQSQAAPLGERGEPGEQSVSDPEALPATEPEQEPAAGADQAGRRYRPADLTIQSAPSRLERARVSWRQLDNLGRLDAKITEPRLLHCATIAVVSPKGGVGKTTVTALLGTLFSLLRRDPIVAVDTNPDFGSLGRVLTPDQSWYVDDLAKLVLDDDELSLTSLDSLLGRAVHGLLVVPAPTDPDRMKALDEDAYRRVITRLKDFFSLILLDCGTGLQDPALAAAIAGADQVVLLTDAQPATASLVAESTELLHQWGRPITVVVNRMPPKGAKLDVARLSRYLPAARGLVVVPDDVVAATRLATGRFDWRDAPESWQYALRRLATVLVADWERLGLAR